jgi:hypothetical protein
MGEVVDLNVVTKLDLPPEKVLNKAADVKFLDVVILGFDEEGDFYFAASSADGGDVLWLLEMAKKQLMEVGS